MRGYRDSLKLLSIPYATLGRKTGRVKSGLGTGSGSDLYSSFSWHTSSKILRVLLYSRKSTLAYLLFLKDVTIFADDACEKGT